MKDNHILNSNHSLEINSDKKPGYFRDGNKFKGKYLKTN
jgi:hypothetical protein